MSTLLERVTSKSGHVDPEKLQKLMWPQFFYTPTERFYFREKGGRKRLVIVAVERIAGRVFRCEAWRSAYCCEFVFHEQVAREGRQHVQLGSMLPSWKLTPKNVHYLLQTLAEDC